MIEQSTTCILIASDCPGRNALKSFAPELMVFNPTNMILDAKTSFLDYS